MVWCRPALVMDICGSVVRKVYSFRIAAEGIRCPVLRLSLVRGRCPSIDARRWSAAAVDVELLCLNCPSHTICRSGGRHTISPKFLLATDTEYVLSSGAHSLAFTNSNKVFNVSK